MAEASAEPAEPLIPLYGFLEGDTIGLLMLGHGSDTVAQLAERLVASASVRVAPREKLRVRCAGRVLDPEMTLREAGLTALERFDVAP